MFRINRKTDYAVRVLLALAKHPTQGRMSTSTIQEQMLVPRPFLQHIVADLSRAGLIHTFPGPKGGIQMARSADDISLQDIVEAIDGPILVSDCLIENGECVLDVACPVRLRWERIQSMIVQELDRASLSQLAIEAFEKEQANPKRAPIPPGEVIAMASEREEEVDIGQ